MRRLPRNRALPFASCGAQRDVRSPAADDGRRELPRFPESRARRAQTRNFRERVCAPLAAQTWVARAGGRLRLRSLPHGRGSTEPAQSASGPPEAGRPAPRNCGCRVPPALALRRVPGFMKTRYCWSPVAKTTRPTTTPVALLARRRTRANCGVWVCFLVFRGVETACNASGCSGTPFAGEAVFVAPTFPQDPASCLRAWRGRSVGTESPCRSRLVSCPTLGARCGFPRPLRGVLRTFGRDRWYGLPGRDPEGDARPVGHPPVGVAEQSHQSGYE